MLLYSPISRDTYLFSQLRLAILPLALSVGIMLTRVGVTDRIGYYCLPWNLFLAWVPLGFAALLEFRRVRGQTSNRSVIALITAWLLFLPNAPYIVTDVIHIIHQRDRAFWFDLAHVMSFSFAGLMAGIASMRLIHRTVRERFSGAIADLFILTSAMLSGLGIYVGRVYRWNSWDVIQRPWTLFTRSADLLLNPWDNRHALALSLLFGALFAVCYWVISPREQHHPG